MIKQRFMIIAGLLLLVQHPGFSAESPMVQPSTPGQIIAAPTLCVGEEKVWDEFKDSDVTIKSDSHVSWQSIPCVKRPCIGL